jgi:hypothetical protein
MIPRVIAALNALELHADTLDPESIRLHTAVLRKHIEHVDAAFADVGRVCAQLDALGAP